MTCPFLNTTSGWPASRRPRASAGGSPGAYSIAATVATGIVRSWPFVLNVKPLEFRSGTSPVNRCPSRNTIVATSWALSTFESNTRTTTAHKADIFLIMDNTLNSGDGRNLIGSAVCTSRSNTAV